MLSDEPTASSDGERESEETTRSACLPARESALAATTDTKTATSAPATTTTSSTPLRPMTWIVRNLSLRGMWGASLNAVRAATGSAPLEARLPWPLLEQGSRAGLKVGARHHL